MVLTLEGALEKRWGQVRTCGEDGCPSFGGGILINEKNSKMGGPLALDGCRWMGGHNNQPKVGIYGGRGIEEERRPGRNVWGVLSYCLERRIDKEKKRQQKYVVAFDSRWRMKITQQPTKSTPVQQRRWRRVVATAKGSAGEGWINHLGAIELCSTSN